MPNPLFFGISASGWSGATNITRSAWFDGSADYLSRSSVTGASTRKWSIFGAFRVTDLSARNRFIFECASGTSSQTALLLRQDEDLEFFDYNSSGGVNARVRSDGLIRDSEWYTFLCVCDTANSTEAHRWRLYVNAVEQSTDRTNPDENYDTSWNNGTSQHIGVESYGSLNDYWEGSITAMLHADNTVLTPSDVWDSDTVGTNGTVYYPKPKSALTALANSGGTASFFLSSDIGDGTDDSSKGNNFTANSMSDSANGSDDSPTDPLPIFNPLFRGGGTVYFEEGGAVGGSGDSSEANLLVVTPGFYSGQHVIEFDITNASSYPKVGLIDAATMRDDSVHATSGSHELGAAAVPGSYGYDPSGLILHEGSTIDSGPASFTTNDHIAVEVDLDSDVIRWYKDGSLQSTTSSAGLEAPVFFALNAYNGSDARIIAEDASMTHTPTTGYTPPKYSNLAAPSEQGVDLFQALIYSGNASTQSITGAGFQPDLIWGKDKPSSTDFELYDSTRGTTKVIFPSDNGAEQTRSGVTAFDSDGFSLGSHSGMNASGTNNQVAWCWRGNAGTTSSNGNGSVTTTVQVAPEGHMSIATLTLAGADATLGHGLSGAPDFVTVKTLTGTDAWYTWMTGMGGTDFLQFDSTDGVSTAPTVYTSAPTATVINSGTNFGAGDYVMLCFRNVPGICDIGAYVGNGDADGPMLNVGFKGRWIIIKSSASGGGWVCFDTARDTVQPLTVYLQTDSPVAETASGLTIDALATGFKIRDTHSWLNTSGTTYHYITFADVAAGSGLPPILGR